MKMESIWLNKEKKIESKKIFGIIENFFSYCKM